MNRNTGTSTDRLAEAITWSASKQTYFTIRLLADPGRVEEAYRTYAYFRWVDDRLDEGTLGRAARVDFVERQQGLVERLYRGERPEGLSREETMLAELVASDPDPRGGLHTYIRDMMAVMAFDAGRRWETISQIELNEYTRWLATAVTEAMHYFIGHDCCPPLEGRYQAVSAAHIVHMLRDAVEDAAAGYINIPREYLDAHRIGAEEMDSAAYRGWVRGRVELARAQFQTGRDYLARVPNLRCRLAGFAYMARFNGVLDAIERDGYRLRAEYKRGSALWAGLKMAWQVLGMAAGSLRLGAPGRKLPEM